jgi:RNA polymerase sigma-70 factor (ECF subfamily)
MKEGQITDEELVKKSANGDRRAFEALYDRYSGRVFHYFLNMLGRDEQLAMDFSQELFLKLVHHGKSFDQRRSFKTWFFSMANNMCKNHYRHREVKLRAVNEMAQNRVEGDKSGRNLDRRAFKEALDRELDRLDPDRKNFFILRYKYHLSIKEIAEITEMAEGTVKSGLFYTLKKLSTELVAFNPKT